MASHGHAPLLGRVNVLTVTSGLRVVKVHHLNIPVIVARLSAKPCIRVESGAFVGRFGDQEYELGPTEAGLTRAIRRTSEPRRGIQAEVA
jgi:hypothetical protein